MKKFKLGVCLLLIILLTGCVKYDITNTVSSDKKFTLTIFNGILNEYYSKESLADSRKKYKDLGYTVTDQIESKYSGLKLTKEYTSIDKVSTTNLTEVKLMDLLETNTEDVKLFKVEKNGSISKYTANLLFDVTSQSVSEQTNQDYSEYAETMYFGYSVALPTNAKIISHNADKTEKDNHILMWEVKYGSSKPIKYTFEIDTSLTGENTFIEENKNNDENPENDESETNPLNNQKDNSKKTNNKEDSFFSSILGIGFVLLIVGSIIYLKREFKKKKKNDDPTIIYHNQPPKR